GGRRGPQPRAARRWPRRGTGPHRPGRDGSGRRLRDRDAGRRRVRPARGVNAAAAPRAGDRLDAALAWYFVVVWGSGYLATKVALQYAPPFTFLSLRFAIGIA